MRRRHLGGGGIDFFFPCPSAAGKNQRRNFSGLAVSRFLRHPWQRGCILIEWCWLCVCCYSRYKTRSQPVTEQIRQHHYFTFRRNDRDIWSGQGTATDTTVNRICWLVVAVAVDCCWDGSRRYCRQTRLRRYWWIDNRKHSRQFSAHPTWIYLLMQQRKKKIKVWALQIKRENKIKKSRTKFPAQGGENKRSRIQDSSIPCRGCLISKLVLVGALSLRTQLGRRASLAKKEGISIQQTHTQ